MMKKVFLVLLTTLSVILFTPKISFAQACINQGGDCSSFPCCSNLNCVQNTCQPNTNHPVNLGRISIDGYPLNPAPTTDGIRGQFNVLISTLLGWATIIGSIFFLIQIFLGGYTFMTAGGDTGKVAEGRQRIINGLIGLIIVVSAYAIAGLIANLLQIPIYNPLVDSLFLH